MTPAAARIPSCIDDVTPSWLTAALAMDVTAVRAEQIAQDTGFSSFLYRVHLSGGDGVPPSAIVKLPGSPEARGAMGLMDGYGREMTFYRDVAPRAPIDTPHVYAAQRVDDGTDFILVLEDLGEWENADHLAGLSMDRARMCIAALAGLHAWSLDTANDDVTQAFPSIDMPIARDLLLPAFALGWQVYREQCTSSVPSRVARYAERFVDHAPAALRAISERSMLLHGDIRADNMFFAGDRLKIVDFQLACCGVGAADIGYLVSQGLPVDVRRGHDEVLIREYLDHLASKGITDYSFDDAWRHYRFSVAYLMILPVITQVGWDAMTDRSRALCLTLTDRAVAAIDEIDALEVFE